MIHKKFKLQLQKFYKYGLIGHLMRSVDWSQLNKFTKSELNFFRSVALVSRKCPQSSWIPLSDRLRGLPSSHQNMAGLAKNMAASQLSHLAFVAAAQNYLAAQAGWESFVNRC